MDLYLVISLSPDDYPAVKVFTDLDLAKYYARTLSDFHSIERHTVEYSRSELILDWG